MTLNRQNHAPRPLQVRVLASKDETDPTTFRFHHCWHLSAVGLLSDWSQASWSLVLHLKNASNKEILILWSPIPHSIFAKCNFSISRDKITVKADIIHSFPARDWINAKMRKKREWFAICHFSKFEIPRIGQRPLVQMLQDGAPAAPEAPAVTTTTTATAPVQEVQYTNKRFLDTNVYKSGGKLSLFRCIFTSNGA